MITSDWLAARIEIQGSCWEWQSLNREGYGQLNRSGKVRRAHRFIYESMVGPIPVGLDIDHLCRNRPCVNPDHLEPVTRAVNMQRSPIVGRVNINAAYCSNGHEYSTENTLVRKDGNGRRQCRTCMRAAKQRYRDRLSGKSIEDVGDITPDVHHEAITVGDDQ